MSTLANICIKELIIISRFNPLLNTSNYVCQKFQEFPKETFRPDEIPRNSRCCLEGHYDHE